jgi:hypothetical protein
MSLPRTLKSHLGENQQSLQFSSCMTGFRRPPGGTSLLVGIHLSIPNSDRKMTPRKRGYRASLWRADGSINHVI